MVRFHNELPTVVWYSQHSSGQAFKYEVVMKDKANIRVCDSLLFAVGENCLLNKHRSQFPSLATAPTPTTPLLGSTTTPFPSITTKRKVLSTTTLITVPSMIRFTPHIGISGQLRRLKPPVSPV
jgi:hypothetical protein